MTIIQQLNKCTSNHQFNDNEWKKSPKMEINTK